MISPIKTVVENCTERAVNYRFSCIQIFWDLPEQPDPSMCAAVICLPGWKTTWSQNC